MTIGTHIINQYDLYFDPAESLNASLYLCNTVGSGDAAVNAAIARLKQAQLWSGRSAKQIADAQKPIYAEQMQFIACIELQTSEGALLLARYKHSKFPSDHARWQKWIECLSV